MMNTSQVAVDAFKSGGKSAIVAAFTFALLSTLVLSFVLLFIVWVVLSTIFKRTSYQNLSREAFFFRSQLGQYATCLLFSQWITSLSGMIDLKWISEGGAQAGTSCTIQGALRQMGQWGTFFFMVAMGIHTFNTLVLRNRPPQWLGSVIITIACVTALIISLAPLAISSHDNDPIYSVDGFTCGISKAYPVPHMLLYFLPLFLASLLSVVVYSLIFLMLRGTLVINGGIRIQLDPERRLRLRNGTFEDYQRFVYSVARTMLWLPITFILVLFPSSLVQLMDISGNQVPSGAMAFSYILKYLDGIVDVIILFNILRTLGPVVKSTLSADSEKGRWERPIISRPKYDWNPRSTFASTTRGSVMKSAPPARPPSSILQESASRPSSLAKSLFQAHKKTGSANSSSRLLTPEPPSRSHSPTPSIERPEYLISAPLTKKIVSRTPILEPEPAVLSEAVQKPEQASLQLSLLSADSPSHRDSSVSIISTGLTPSPRGKRSRVSRDLNPTPGSPTLSIAPPTSAPFLEVTLSSAPSSPLADGVSSLISMYLSRNSTVSAELPLFPAAVVQRESSADLPVIVPPEHVGFPLKAAVSIGAVGGRQIYAHPPVAHPELPPVSLASPAHSTDASHYSDTEVESPPPPQARPSMQPTQPLRLGKTPTTNTQPRTLLEQRSSEKSQGPRGVHDRLASRTLPMPPGPPSLARSASLQSYASSQTRLSGHKHQGSLSSHHRYL